MLYNEEMNAMPDPEACDLLNQMLRYNPKKRISILRALAHPYFDELRDQRTYLPTGNCIPDIFNFTEKELSQMSGELRDSIIPEWYDRKTTAQMHEVDFASLILYDEIGST